MSSQTPPDEPEAPQPAAEPIPAAAPHRERELGPEPVRRPEHFLEINDRLVPEGDLMPTQPLPTLR
jgi:hypothetical protein